MEVRERGSPGERKGGQMKDEHVRKKSGSGYKKSLMSRTVLFRGQCNTGGFAVLVAVRKTLLASRRYEVFFVLFCIIIIFLSSGEAIRQFQCEASTPQHEARLRAVNRLSGK